MENIIIKCKDGSFEITDRQLNFLKYYKSVADDNNISNSTYFGYKNINLFLNFLANPSDNLLDKIEITDIKSMIECIKTFIDISCEYALSNDYIDRKLYRYENKDNINGYKNGKLTSLKSTSNKATTIRYNFSNSEQVPLVFKVAGFCPYIKIDDIIKTNLFSNEEEYLLPPYVNCILTDQYENHYSERDELYRIGIIKDDYKDANPNKMIEEYHKYFDCVDSFRNLFIKDSENGKVSEELRNVANTINEYLSEYAKCQYFLYKVKSDKKYYDRKMHVETYWNGKYRGIEEAIRKYCTNQDSNRSWIYSSENNVWALEYLIENEYFTESEIYNIFNNDDPKLLDELLKNRYDKSKYNSLDESEYQTFLDLFNTAGGYNELAPSLPDEIEAANKLAYLEFINRNKDDVAII